jgi:hypothetical protein
MQHEEPFFGPAVQRPLSEDDVHELAPELDEVDPELDAPFDPELEPELDFPLDPELEPDEPEEPELPLLPLLPLELEPPSSDEQPETKTMTEDARERTEMMRATFMTKSPLGKCSSAFLPTAPPRHGPPPKSHGQRAILGRNRSQAEKGGTLRPSGAFFERPNQTERQLLVAGPGHARDFLFRNARQRAEPSAGTIGHGPLGPHDPACRRRSMDSVHRTKGVDAHTLEQREPEDVALLGGEIGKRVMDSLLVRTTEAPNEIKRRLVSAQRGDGRKRIGVKTWRRVRGLSPPGIEGRAHHDRAEPRAQGSASAIVEDARSIPHEQTLMNHLRDVVHEVRSPTHAGERLLDVATEHPLKVLERGGIAFGTCASEHQVGYLKAFQWRFRGSGGHVRSEQSIVHDQGRQASTGGGHHSKQVVVRAHRAASLAYYRGSGAPRRERRPRSA